VLLRTQAGAVPSDVGSTERL